jgi:hypothetical protein
MAYTQQQLPNQLVATNNPIVFTVYDDTNPQSASVYKYRYICKVFINGASNPNAVIKIYPNSSNYGVFDISEIVRTYIETQEKNVGNQESINGSIHSIGISEATNLYSQNTSQLAKIVVSFFYESSSAATTAPSVTDPSVTATIYAIEGGLQFEDGIDIDSGSAQVSAGNLTANRLLWNYIPSSNSKNFLTNSPKVQFVKGSSTAGDNVDELTVAFINDGLVTDGDSVVKMALLYYNSSGVQIGSTQFFTNNTTNGGKATADDVKNSLLYFGCGTANLQNSTITPDGGSSGDAKPSNFSNWAYYVIYGADGSGNQETDKYYFYRYGSGASVDDRHQSCTRFDNVRLAWRNRLGAWDYMNFRGKSIESVDITSNEVNKVAGSWDSTVFDTNDWDRGRSKLYTEATRKLTINSDWLNADEGAWLEELFTSTNVQILGGSNVVYPVILTDKRYTKKTSVNNKVKIQYTIKLEYANKVNTNS